MSFTNLFESGNHSRNLSHFASLVQAAHAGTDLTEEEVVLLARFARKLGIHDSEHKAVLKDPTGYPINPPVSHDERLRRLHDLFTIIIADHIIEEDEHAFLERYAVGLGFDHGTATAIIKRTIQIYTGGIDFEDYKYLLDK